MPDNLEQTNQTLEQEAEALLDKVAGEKPKAKVEEKPETSSATGKASEPESKVSDEKAEETAPYKTFLTEQEFNSEVETLAKRRVQANSDKLTQPLYDQINNLKKQNVEFAKKLNDRDDNRDILSIVNGKTEELGEDKAQSLEDGLRRFYKNYRDNESKLAQVQDKEAEVNKRHELLNVAEKRQKARDLFWKHFFSGGEHLISQENDFISDMLSENYSLREMEMLAEKRGADYRAKQAKKPTAKPDSGKTGSSGPGGKFTRGNLAEYSPKGKSVNQMMKDAEAVLDQITK